jgi:putative DNA primase/helicase
MAHIDFDGIKAAALRNVRSLLPDLIPGGKFRSLEYVVRNPTRADETPGSFSINYKTGAWCDFATDDTGSDLISLVAFVRGVGQGEAARELADKLGMPALKPNGAAIAKPSGHSNGATEAPTPKIYSWGNDGPLRQEDEVRRHTYRNSAGVAVRVVLPS